MRRAQADAKSVRDVMGLGHVTAHVDYGKSA